MRVVNSIALFGCMLLSGAGLFGDVPDVPNELRAPAGQAVLLHFHGEGRQIYVCQNSAGVYGWKLKGPDAKLFDDNGKLAGRHFAGPTWEANDGSRVTGKLTASVASPDAGSIPWLLLSAASHSGSGVMEQVQSIQRIETRGGAAPGSACSSTSENTETSVPYEASYYFYGQPGAK